MHVCGYVLIYMYMYMCMYINVHLWELVKYFKSALNRFYAQADSGRDRTKTFCQSTGTQADAITGTWPPLPL